MRIPSGVTDQYIYFVAVDSTDFTTRETGLSSFTVYRSRNGAAAAAMTTPTINETSAANMPGVYELLLDEDMTIDAGDDSQEMVFHITHAGMAPVTRTIELYRPKITAGNTLTVASDGDLTEVNTLTGHTAQTGDSYARLGAPAGASVSADIATVDSNVDAVLADTGTDGVVLANDAITAAKIAADAIGASELAADAVAEIADAVWDEATSGHVTSGSFGQRLASIRTGTAQAGAAGSITLDASASATNDFYNNTMLVITGGTGVGQARIIEDYDGTTKVATVNPNWATTPSSDSVFVIIPFDDIPGASAPSAASIADAVWDEAQADHVGAGSFGVVATEVADILTDTADMQPKLGTPAGASISADIAAIEAQTDDIGAAGAGLTAVPWNAAWDAEVQSEVNDALVALGLDHLVSTAVAGADVADDSIFAKLVSAAATADWDTFVNTTDALQAIRDKETDIETDTQAIETDTQDIQSRLPAALVGGRMDSDVGAKTGNVALSTQEKADVNAEVADVINTDTVTLPGQTAPPAAPTKEQILGWLYKVLRNKIEQTATTWSLYDDAGTTVDAKSTVSDSAGTYTKGEIASGP